jgi:hypothetical protein
MIDTLITSKTRVKLLLKFFLNPGNAAHLRGLETEFGESSNAIRLELNRLEKANMLLSQQEGNKKLFKVNSSHPLYSEINSIVRKYFGLDVIVNNIASRLGDLDSVYLTGDIAEGKDTGIIDLALIGKVDRTYLSQLVEKAEKLVNRKIAYLVYSPEEWMKNNHQQTVLIWNARSNGKEVVGTLYKATKRKKSD